MLADEISETLQEVLSKRALADLRRIVACVNACEGVSTKALEEGAAETQRAVASPRLAHAVPESGGRVNLSPKKTPPIFPLFIIAGFLWLIWVNHAKPPATAQVLRFLPH